MNIKLTRFKDDGKSTLSTISIDKEFFSFGLEDTFNEPKIYGKTRIPAGEYEIKFRDQGGMTKKYKAKYKNHIGMMWLQSVPGFKYVYIHIGNHNSQTNGCILVGTGCESTTGSMNVQHSANAYKKLYSKAVKAHTRGSKITIQIEDKDRA